MQATLDPAEKQSIVDQVIQQIRKDYELIPKGSTNFINLDLFRKRYCAGKDKEWVKMFVFKPFPETKRWALNVYAGQGHPIRINEPLARQWMKDHFEDIDWNASLPRG